MTVLLMILGLLALVFIDVPIAIAMGVVAIVAMIAGSGLDALPDVALVLFTGATKFPLIAIPLFILAGSIMNAGGISQRLIALAEERLRSAMRLRRRKPQVIVRRHRQPG